MKHLHKRLIHIFRRALPGARRLIPVATLVVIAVVAGLTGLAFQHIDTQPYLQGYPSTELLDRDGKPMLSFLNADQQWQFWRPISELNPLLIKATIAVEDQRFHLHPGVDPIGLCRALWRNILAGGVASGASTLTMQVVKMSQGNDGHSLTGKAAQMINALRLERHAGKDAILEAYLNKAPYGLNMVGCEAAARRYFAKSAQELTLPEAALLAGLPKAPTTLQPLRFPARALARRNHVLLRMRNEGYITHQECATAMQAPLGVAWNDFPAYARHLGGRLASSLPPGARERMTLSRDIQARAETLLKHGLLRFDNNVTNAAAIVVDNEDAAIVAWIGSVSFFTTPGGGQVDACQAPRSPGSALKPFTYALAMAHDQLYPTEVLYDGALDYGWYSPENYDEFYRGLIPAGDALRRSLNIPAIAVLERAGVETIHSFLQECGLTTLTRPADDYGLGLTLGNCETRLDELAAAYVMLANMGTWRPLRSLTGTSASPPREMLRPATCAVLYGMMEQPLPQDPDEDQVRASGMIPKVCWKTGTSTGHHDAWAFVFNRHYTVGVWLGNNTGRSSRHLVGVSAALPLAGRLFRMLTPKSSPAWPSLDGLLRSIHVCAVSGLPASEWCPGGREALFASDQLLQRRCDVHALAQTDGLASPDGGVIERWPGMAKGWDLANVVAPVEVLPGEGDATVRRLTELQITQPEEQAEYVLTGQPAADRVRLRTSVDLTASLSWYLDGQFLGKSSPDAPLQMDLTPGEHKLTCMVSSGEGVTPGATATVAFTVSEPGSEAPFQ